MKTLLLVTLLLSSFFAHAGNGSSGGGHIYGNQLNPWFLSNTKVVRYCVIISPDFSQIPESRILELIKNSISYWKTTFANYSTSFQQDFKIDSNLGTQNFVYSEECSPETDIKFQLGHLTRAQRKHADYRSLHGITIREGYDEVNLKGKGFIYIAPEEGPLKPRSTQRAPRPWSAGKNQVLLYTLMHELGHVFGLQDDHYALGGLMSATFVDTITRNGVVDHINQSTIKDVISPFGCNKDFEGSREVEVQRTTVETDVSTEDNKSNNNEDELLKYLGIEQEKFKVSIDTVKSLTSIFIDQKLLGIIDVSAFRVHGEDVSPAVNLYLTPKQNVFKDFPADYYHLHHRIYQRFDSVQRKDLVLKLANGKKLDVFITFDRTCSPQISTVFNGKLYFDIFMNY